MAARHPPGAAPVDAVLAAGRRCRDNLPGRLTVFSSSGVHLRLGTSVLQLADYYAAAF